MLISVWEFSPWPMARLRATALVQPRGPYRRSKYSFDCGYNGVISFGRSTPVLDPKPNSTPRCNR
jgi:hypothetical protein